MMSRYTPLFFEHRLSVFLFVLGLCLGYFFGAGATLDQYVQAARVVNLAAGVLLGGFFVAFFAQMILWGRRLLRG